MAGTVAFIGRSDGTGPITNVSLANPLPTTGTFTGTVTSTPLAVTPVAGTASAIVTGGTALTIVTGPCNGGYIVNPSNAAAQTVTAENLYIDPVGTPGSTDAAANGTTIILAPGQSFVIPTLKAGSVIKANAATTGHKFSVVVW